MIALVVVAVAVVSIVVGYAVGKGVTMYRVLRRPELARLLYYRAVELAAEYEDDKGAPM